VSLLPLNQTARTGLAGIIIPAALGRHIMQMVEPVLLLSIESHLEKQACGKAVSIR